VAFPDLGGHVLMGPHPAVVVQADRLARSATVIVALLTSAPRSAPERPPYLVPVAAHEADLPKDGFIKCDQLATLPVTLLGPRVGRLNPEAIGRLNDALRFVLTL
jgi:mRNA-degrading endonuclease toxin of MazEF toxin-antitoxin module